MSKSFSIKSLLENSLFIWAGLILLLALSSGRMLVPDWIQVLGRSHPLLLHFPIVLLLMGLLFIWIPGLDAKPDAKSIGDTVLLAGCNFAGLTVIAGLILAAEDYEGQNLLWHKWSGIAVFFLCVGLYFFRTASKNKLKPASLLLAFGIFITGHLGANITHGEDFLLAPIQEKESSITPLAEAEIFEDLVLPILESKCMSCHQDGKIKGELRMDHLEGLQKGGKSGPFVLAGDLKNSLLIQRISLDPSEKKHMPPINKAQLSEEELEILKEWVANGASFDQKVVDIPSEKKLYLLASKKFESQKTYTFDPASQFDVEKLNTFFRRVASIYPESPALEVSYFSIAAFDPNSLRELKKVQDQILKINLNKMPLKDVDLSVLSEMKHLEEIQANFTDLNTEQIKLIAAIPSIKYLAVSGNKIDSEALKAISEMKQLIRLYLWQTGLNPSQQNELQSKLQTTQINFGFDGSQVIYPLNKPKVSFEKVIFRDSVEVQISHPIKTAEIRYTVDDTEPDSITSPIYSKPIWIRKSGKLRTKVFAKEWKASPEASYQFLKSGYAPTEYKLLSKPNKEYLAKGDQTLFDQIKGQNNHRSGEWLGFQDEPMLLEIKLDPKNNYSDLVISLLYHEASYIFPPASVEILKSENGKWINFISEQPEQSVELKDPRASLLRYDLSKADTEIIRIKLNPVKSLPKWHPGAGAKGWVFVDEILIN